MKDKYYTPAIEEFHVGFEYEELINDDMLSIRSDNHIDDIYWCKIKLSDNYISFSELPSKIKYEQIRVKYLDKEDIESLGFIYKGKTVDLWFEKEGTFLINTWTSYKIIIHYGIDHRLYVEAQDTGNEECLFQGEIKNKSELKTLLKQLNII